VNQHVCIIRPRPEDAVSDYLAAVIASDAVQAQIFRNENGISRDGLNFEQIGNLVVPVPPVCEQKAISKEIVAKVEGLGALVTKIRDAIALLREYRTALISAAVTGQIDVSKEDPGFGGF
ncbi:MAG: restriction endonuclease subunit S, partial [bacterium]